MRSAVFLDRDGTLNEEVSYLSHPEQLRLIPGTLEALRQLQAQRYLCIIITNQSGIARGYFSERELNEVHGELRQMLRAAQADVDAIYYCPHHPTSGQGVYRSDCSCRKPQPGLLLQAAKDFDIDLANSYMIGDKASDLLAGIAAGCHTILTLTGYGRQSQNSLENNSIAPDYIARDLKDAAKWISTHRSH